ncbi:dATP/dGTP pyrophosphohydrolase domain-containing protein [Microbulbifer sp. ANSA003]|uniref:dATP/dGTP pyrophosphohydrolase domain-containing protein n=1 Tax=Microbulbifer sp. ANSA003 TaxID=3243360 RepID=UPI0040437947
MNMTAKLNLVEHLYRQREFSKNTFGPGSRVEGILDHMSKEIIEVRNKPQDLSEWIDLALLSFDGAWRAGYTPEQIAAALTAKQEENEGRSWPDWRNAPKDRAIEHNRSTEEAA